METIDGSDSQWQPSFIGLGAQKSASAWLSHCLREHPEIYIDKKKEMHFFDTDANYRKGIQYYKSLFSNKYNLLDGEITPAYFYEKEVAARIHKHFPNVKLIVCLRNPADRAWSHYNYGVKVHARISVYSSFSEAFKSDRSLADNGRYGEQLQRYLELFDEKQIKIIFHEDIRNNPVETIKDVYRFIGVTNTNYTPIAANQRVHNTQSIVLPLKHARTWGYLLKLRNYVHKYPKFESFLKTQGLITRIKTAVRTGTKAINENSLQQTPNIMSDVERQLVIDELLTDINTLEKITGRNLRDWKSIASDRS